MPDMLMMEVVSMSDKKIDYEMAMAALSAVEKKAGVTMERGQECEMKSDIKGREESDAMVFNYEEEGWEGETERMLARVSGSNGSRVGAEGCAARWEVEVELAVRVTREGEAQQQQEKYQVVVIVYAATEGAADAAEMKLTAELQPVVAVTAAAEGGIREMKPLGVQEERHGRQTLKVVVRSMGMLPRDQKEREGRVMEAQQSLVEELAAAEASSEERKAAEKGTPVPQRWEGDNPPKLQYKRGTTATVDSAIFSLRRKEGEEEVSIVKVEGDVKTGLYMELTVAKGRARVRTRMYFKREAPAGRATGERAKITFIARHACGEGMALQHAHEEACRGRLLLTVNPVKPELEDARALLDKHESKTAGPNRCCYYVNWSVAKGRVAACMPTTAERRGSGCKGSVGSCREPPKELPKDVMDEVERARRMKRGPAPSAEPAMRYGHARAEGQWSARVREESKSKSGGSPRMQECTNCKKLRAPAGEGMCALCKETTIGENPEEMEMEMEEGEGEHSEGREVEMEEGEVMDELPPLPWADQRPQRAAQSSEGGEQGRRAPREAEERGEEWIEDRKRQKKVRREARAAAAAGKSIMKASSPQQAAGRKEVKAAAAAGKGTMKASSPQQAAGSRGIAKAGKKQ